MLTDLDGKAWIHIHHICGHWERHPLPERAEVEMVEASLRSLKCSRCEKKERDGISVRR